VARSCGYGNEIWCSVKDGEFLGRMSDFQLLREVS
jgi:hypothetical protein